MSWGSDRLSLDWPEQTENRCTHVSENIHSFYRFACFSLILSTCYLLRDAGQRGGFSSQSVSLTHGEQRARQDGAEVVEGPSVSNITFITGRQNRSNRSREQLGQ